MKFAAVAVLVGGCSAPGAPGAPVLPTGELVDLTHTFDEHTIYWPTEEAGFVREQSSQGFTEKGYYYEAGGFSTAEHGGTHIDAPIHFYQGRNTVDQIVPEQLIGPGIVVDVRKACKENRDYLVSVEDFEAWETRHGPIPHGAIVLLRTGFWKFWPDRKKYMGTDARGPEAVQDLHFPGLHPDAARWLTTERSIRAIGLDTPSIDHGPSANFESHIALFEKNVPAFESVTNLDELPAVGFTIIALPMKIRGGSGGPLRIVAIVP